MLLGSVKAQEMCEATEKGNEGFSNHATGQLFGEAWQDSAELVIEGMRRTF